jgi:adenylate cyclase
MTENRSSRSRQALTRFSLRAREFDRRQSAIDAVRRLRRALPGDPGFGDPLSAAGRDSAGTVARLANRLYDDQPRTSREVGLATLQVWHSMLARTGRGGGDRTVTLLFTDLVGFSAWALQAGDEDALRLLREVAAAMEPVLARRGQIVKRLGDGVMAVYPSPQLGFDAVVAARERLAEIEVAVYRPVIRAGLHVGRPRAIGGDYLGIDVTIAARLAQQANGGEILVSDAVRRRLPELEARRKRRFSVKGVPEDLTAYSVVTD